MIKVLVDVKLDFYLENSGVGLYVFKERKLFVMSIVEWYFRVYV